ncbi:MAG TPA: hypothetical protein VFR37_04905, partial [Longimicrobium sp.]|nr:hypothetical protein [Longimicrobium sp.]
TEAEWREMAQMMGANNMGGPVLGFLEDFPEPTLARGAVMAGMDHGATGHGAAPASRAGAAQGHAGHAAAAGQDATKGLQPGAPHGSMSMERMMEMHERMMADPVIRERVAADPVLRQMMAEIHGETGMGGMQHGTSQATADSMEAVDFVVRLLSDPEVEARVRADPRLHQLWSDPAVQRRLVELRRQRAQPQPATPEHRH